MGWSDMHPLVAALVTAFGIGAWVSVNGIWVELPLLVSLPEGWALPSYLSIIIQIANIGPIAFSTLKIMKPQTKPAPFIYLVLATGCLASFFLIFFWDETSLIGGVTHSTALFVLVFFLALVDCTSSVLYLPYMTLWKSNYLPIYSSGEGLSGLLPAMVALIQGSSDGGGDSNNNDTNTVKDTEESESELLFSVEIFFLILFLMLVVSYVSFIVLDLLPFIQSERDNSKLKIENHQNGQHINEGFSNTNDISLSVSRLDLNDSSKTIIPTSYFEWSKNKLLLLLFGQLFASMLTNGFLPSIQSYSCGPYGNLAYHWAAIIVAVANPLAALTTVFFKKRVKLVSVLILSIIGTILAAYIIATGAMSPEPPMVNTVYGSVLIVLIWGSFAYIMTFVRVEINNLLRKTEGPNGEKALFWSGGCTQLGSFIGALTAFLLVNTFGVFHE